MFADLETFGCCELRHCALLSDVEITLIFVVKQFIAVPNIKPALVVKRVVKGQRAIVTPSVKLSRCFCRWIVVLLVVQEIEEHLARSRLDVLHESVDPWAVLIVAEGDFILMVVDHEVAQIVQITHQRLVHRRENHVCA